MQIVRDLTGGLGVDVAIEAAGSARAVEEALDLIRDGGRYVIAGHYTDAGRARSTSTSRSTASISRSAAAGAARCRTSCARCACSSGITPTIPWRAIGAKTYALTELNQALADAEAMRLPKALVKPS